MPAPSWDLALTVIFLIGIAFGYILQRDKIVGTLLGVYAGLVVTQAVAGSIQQLFQGDSFLFNQVWIKANANPFSIRAVLFGLTIAIVATKANIASGKSKSMLLSPLEIIVYSIMTTGLIIASVFFFMPGDARTPYMLTSQIAKFIIQNYTWWIVSPILFMIVSGFIHKKESHE